MPLGNGTDPAIRAWQGMKHARVLLSVPLLPLALAVSGPVHALPVSAPDPEVDWEVGVIALVGIGVVGGGMMMAGNARRRRETRAIEQESRANAARARAAITGGDAEDDLHKMAENLEKMSAEKADPGQFRARKPRAARQGDSNRERDQNSPGTSLQRTRSQ